MFECLEALLAQSSGAKVFPGRQVAPEWIEDAESRAWLPVTRNVQTLAADLRQSPGWQLPGLHALRSGAPRSRRRRPDLLRQVGRGRRRRAEGTDRATRARHG